MKIKISLMLQARREVGAIAKDIQAAQKQVSSLESKVEQRKADRHSLLKQCKVCIYQQYTYGFI